MALLPRPTAESDKYRRGVVGIVAGSDRFAGAAVLATGGAIRGGAGMVRVLTGSVPAAAVRQTWPEALLTVHPGEAETTPFPMTRYASRPGPDRSVGRVQAWVAGPGMGTGEDAAGWPRSWPRTCPCSSTRTA